MSFLSRLKDFTPSSDGKELERMLKELEKYEVKVGFNADSGFYQDEKGRVIPVVEVAAWNEYGTEKIPERPFMRGTYEKNKGDFVKLAKQEVASQLAGHRDAKTALNNIGIYEKGRMQDYIVKEKFTPNAPSTIAKKGSSKPLIDSGQMRQSVQYQVVRKGK